MNILIIGGSRFVGPFLIQRLLKYGHNITVLNRGNYKIQDHRVTQIKHDRNQGFSLNEKFDVVADMCAYNGLHTQAAVTQLKFDHFVHFSTAAVYKKTDSFPLTENSPLGDWPVWGEYNKGKVECEAALERSDISYATIRSVYILGPRNYVDRERFIYSKIKNGQTINLPGDGGARVQFVFVNEVASLFAKIIENKITGSFNCCGDDIVTLKQLVEVMGKIVGKQPKILITNKELPESEFPFANETFFCSNHKAKSLGIKFGSLKTNLLRDYLAYYKGAI
ncbi:MAG TPA: NAD-dependent epimerase/dehydratase family protein [Candidatus Bilamarchaeaceae archaeon]|nr:NAD-dependent epimerase/dehydratase family protein [Candidatus Bilamarchaeaceae archaeon]